MTDINAKFNITKLFLELCAWNMTDITEVVTMPIRPIRQQFQLCMPIRKVVTTLYNYTFQQYKLSARPTHVMHSRILPLPAKPLYTTMKLWINNLTSLYAITLWD